MYTQIDINSIPGGTILYHCDIMHVFVAYKLNSLNGTSSLWRGAIWGTDGLDGNYKPLVCFSPQSHLLISGTFNDYIVTDPLTNPTQWHGKISSGRAQQHAELAKLNQWICLSTHLDRDSTAPNSSFVYCGVKIGSYQSGSKAGASTIVIGDLQPTQNVYVAPLNGSITYFQMIKDKVFSKVEIKLMHYCVCKEMFGITTQDIDLSG